MAIKDSITTSLKRTESVMQAMVKDQALIDTIEKAIEALLATFRGGGKTLFAGNGGSAADAQHMSAEFVSRFMFDRPGLPSIALTTDTSALTAIGNDYGFVKLFARQIEALGRKEDALVVYSTSGTSPNIIEGLKKAKEQGLTTIGLTGTKEGGLMQDHCDILLRVPSDSTPYIQEGHLVIGHILCGAVEAELFGDKR